jgi:sulfate adenylyltransferase subunit 1 (EFTu-like GTPase family)
VARYDSRPGAGTAEVAVTVEDAWQTIVEQTRYDSRF